MAKTPRELAFHTLLLAEKDTSQGIDDLLSNALQKCDLNQQEKRWVMELVYGVTRMKLQLDAMIMESFKGRYRKAQHAVKCLLRMGTFQLKYMHTSEHAAINETVALSRKVKQSQASGLINAVLRKTQNLELEQIMAASTNVLDQLSIETSHPQWLLELWMGRYEMDEVRALCNHNNSIPKTWIRRNVKKVDVSTFESFLGQMKVTYAKSSILDIFYEIDSAGQLITSKEFHEGWFSFQDLAAGVVASLVEPAKGETVVDTCAAPGGKMALISEMAEDEVMIVACDASSKRLVKVHENIRRLGLKGVEVKVCDAAVSPLPEAEKMLLDVPCSGTGVLNRRPDARWKRQPNDIPSLTNIQAQILSNSWQYLKPGGLLVYATCTLEPAENWGLLDSAFERLPGAELVPILNEKLKPYIDERGALSTLPWRDGMDGMFAVKIRKSK